MNSQKYQELTGRTDIPDYTDVRTRIKENANTIHQGMLMFLIASGTLDLMKKKTMYNADHFKLMKLDAEQCKFRDMMAQNPNWLEKIAEDDKLTKLFHYTVGIITEANEMVTALMEGALTNNLDLVNIGEENGDIQWYQARMNDLLGLDLDKQRQVNIDKLKARFPTKFSEESANNRDLNTERTILEG